MEVLRTDVQHGPQLKVVVGTKASVTMTIEDSPRILGTLPGKVRSQVVAFIQRNQDALLRHWRGG